MHFIASLVSHIISNTPSITLSKSLQENHIVFHSQEIGPATYPLYIYINQASESSCCHMHSHLFPIFFNITLSINSSHMSHPFDWMSRIFPHVCFLYVWQTPTLSIKCNPYFSKLFTYVDFPMVLPWFTHIFPHILGMIHQRFPQRRR